MKPTLLITGGSGLLALNWFLQMRREWEVHLILNSRNIYLPGIRKHWVDLTSIKEIVEKVEQIKPSLIVNTVGLTDVEKCEAEPDMAYECNAQIAKNVAIASSKTGIKLIHISTDQLYNGDSHFKSETEKPNPVNYYGYSKWLAEIFVFEHNPESLILRTNFFGWGPSYRRSFSDWIIDCLKHGNTTELFTDVFYTPIYISSLIKIAHQLVEAGQQGVFNVVGEDRISKYKFGIKLCEVFELDKRLIRPGTITGKKSSVRRPLEMTLSNTKLIKSGVGQVHNLDAMLELMCQEKWKSIALKHIEINQG